MPRSPAHSPESSRGSPTSSILLRRQRRPECEPRGVLLPGCPYEAYRFRGPRLYPLQRVTAGVVTGSAKSREAGGSLRTRRLRIDPSARHPSGDGDDEPDHTTGREPPWTGSRVSRPGPEPGGAARGAARPAAARARRARRTPPRVDRRARAPRGAPPRLACIGRADAAARNVRPRSSGGGAHRLPRRTDRAGGRTLRRRGRSRTASPGARCGRAQASRGRATRASGRGTRGADSRSARRSSTNEPRDASPTPSRLVELVFVPGDRYRLVEIEPVELTGARVRGRGHRRSSSPGSAARPFPATRGGAPISCAGARRSEPGGSS